MHEELREKIAGEIAMSEEPGATIRKWREEFGISQQELSRVMEISPSMISDYESGRRRYPRILTVRKIVDALVEIDLQRGGRNVNRFTFTAIGYTIIDSLKAILSMSAFEYIRIYGWTSERALIFTAVTYGRSPMVAIRANPLKPAMVVYVRPKSMDELAVKLADVERIPLVRTPLTEKEITGMMEKMEV